MSEKKTGTIKWFKNDKGFGFAVNEAGEDVFIHYSAILAEGYKTLAEGQSVSFIQVKSEKGWQGAEVEVLETAQNQGAAIAAFFASGVLLLLTARCA